MNSYQSPIDGKAVFNRVCTVFTNSANKTSRIILSMLFLAMLSFQTYAQDDPWTLLKEENGVKVYYQVSACNEEIDPTSTLGSVAIPHKHLELKIENTNAQGIEISWYQDIKTDGTDGLVKITAASGETKIDQCAKVPHLVFTQTENDNYPKSFLEYLDLFKVVVNP